MAVKRRTVWITDEDWGTLDGIAKANGQTISALIRDRLVTGTALEREVLADPPWLHEPIGRVTAIVEEPDGVRIEAERFSSRPFTPAPKPKGKR